MAVELTEANFDELVVNANKPVVVDFWAEWCGPCRMIGPIIEELSAEYGDKAVFGKLDVDGNNGIAIRYGIRNIPTVLFFKDGKIADKQVGAVPKNIIKAKLDALL